MSRACLVTKEAADLYVKIPNVQQACLAASHTNPSLTTACTRACRSASLCLLCRVWSLYAAWHAVT